MTNAERQKKHREAQAKLGRKPLMRLVTADEAFYLERVLLAMREHPGDVPAMMRTKRGTLRHLDA